MQHQCKVVAPTREVTTPIENNNINAKTQHQHEATTPTGNNNSTNAKEWHLDETTTNAKE
jgi:hypothetical protein